MNTRFLIGLCIIIALVCVPAALAAPKDTRQLISDFSDPAKVAAEQASLPGNFGFLFAANNNLYIKRLGGAVESYTFQQTAAGIALRRGRSLSPPTEVYTTEWAGDAVLGAGTMEACIAKNYMQRGDIVVTGKGARTISFTVRLACMGQQVGSSPKSVTYQGKNYYKVMPGQTGNEVCQKAGMQCMGMTPSRDASVCQAFHPGASTRDIIHGSQFYWWCQGQDSIVCGQRSGECTVCTACNPNLNCGDEPGPNWGNEIYVECMSQQIQPPPPCNDQRLGQACGRGACGPNTFGRCFRGTQCNQATNICERIPPTLNVIENGDECQQDNQCQSGRCVFDPYMNKNVCDGPRAPGKLCGHGGQCRSDLHCLYYAGQGADRHNRCSCEMFRHSTNC